MKLYQYPSKEAEARVASIVNRGLSFRQEDFLEVTRILEDVRTFATDPRFEDDMTLVVVRRVGS